MTEPGEPGWRVRAGAGLVVNMPMSDALRAQYQREAERERQQIEQEAEARRQQTLERRETLQFLGQASHSHEEILAAQAWGESRNDAIAARCEREAAEAMGKPVRFNGLRRWEVEKSVREREAAEEVTPAGKADLGRLEQALSKVKAALHAATGKTVV